MAGITIERTNLWYSQRKNIYVYIDKKKVARTTPIERLEIEVSSGKHTVADNNFWAGGSKIIEVDLIENEDKIINMSSFKYTFLAALVGGFAVFLSYSFYRSYFDVEANMTAELIVLLLILIIFFLVFRKIFFKLEKVEVK